MLWRLQAELNYLMRRWPEAVEAYRKLAEFDVRRRSEHLLALARAQARMGQVSAAFKQLEAVATETASSQHIIDVFNFALEHNSVRQAMEVLERRLQARPNDAEVLQRLIDQGRAYGHQSSTR